jgi:hypothetical protein
VLGHERSQPPFGPSAGGRLHHTQLPRRFNDGQADAEGSEERGLPHGCARAGGVEHHPGTVGADGEVVGLA